MIHVLALIETTPGHRNDFLAEFAQVAIPVRQEAGCIEYGAAFDAEGAGAHCEMGNRSLLNRRVLDWLDEQFA